ncbi:MAG: YbaK/EbsC family protein [Candidatus Micrarchaeia archaeon]
MSQKETGNITSFLDAQSIPYEKITHEPVLSAQDAARVRNLALSDAIKSLVVEFRRKDKTFTVCAAIRADRKLDLKKLKAILQADETKLAPLDKLESLTGCAPGGVPPFGHTPKISVLVDKSLFADENKVLEFAAGQNTVAIKMKATNLKAAFEAYGAAFFDLSA